MSLDFKVLLILALSVLGIRLAGLWLSGRQNRPQNHNPVVTPEAKNPYLGLRSQILELKRQKIGLAAPAKPTEPWAAVMDWGVTNGTATVVAISDGTASIYLSSGGGSIGGGQAMTRSAKPLRNGVRRGRISVPDAGYEHLPATSARPSYFLCAYGYRSIHCLRPSRRIEFGSSPPIETG